MPINHRSLLSGQTRGSVAAVCRSGLRAANWLYGAGARVRRWQYDTRRKPIHHADVPVISVGNLTTGGTGKTPVVCDLCRRLRALDVRVAIISRGYGADESGINDEAMEMAARLPDVPHVQHPDRVEAARIAVDELEAQVLVMDDGFQHRRLHRDLDIVTIDATCPFGHGYMLPRGYLREPISSLRRAGLVILTRTDQVPPDALEKIEQTIRSHNSVVAIVSTCHQPSAIIFEKGPEQAIEGLRNIPVALLSAIGNPDAFEHTVGNYGGDVIEHFRLPDHDGYDRETRDRIRDWIESLKTSRSPRWILCTHKDYVKLATDRIAGIDLGYVRIDLKYTSSRSIEVVDRLISQFV